MLIYICIFMGLGNSPHTLRLIGGPQGYCGKEVRGQVGLEGLALCVKRVMLFVFELVVVVVFLLSSLFFFLHLLASVMQLF